jgi:hypothetical protein
MGQCLLTRAACSPDNGRGAFAALSSVKSLTALSAGAAFAAVSRSMVLGLTPSVRAIWRLLAAPFVVMVSPGPYWFFAD